MLINILIFIAVLSIVVFFHELGHFVAAKLCGIYVKRFSIGMPPRLFGVQIGETDYCVGALPLGGFVMMAGQEDVPLSDEEREKEYGGVPEHRWFANKPVWQRMIVLVMGPLMNLVLGIVIYWFIALFPTQVSESETTPRIGEVAAQSPASTAALYRMTGEDLPAVSGTPDATGWQTGDLIVSIDGRKINNISDLAINAMLGGLDKSHDIVIERETAPGKTERLYSRVVARAIDESGNPRFGVGPYETACVGDVLAGSPGEAAGLKAGDIIRRADGNPVSLTTFIKHIEKVPEGGQTMLDVERDGSLLQVPVNPHTTGRILDVSFEPSVTKGDESVKVASPPKVLSLSPGVKDKTGIRRRDVIVQVNGQPATMQVLKDLAEKNPGGTLELKIQRPAVLFGLLQKSENITLSLSIPSVRAIGVALQFKTVTKQYSLAEAVPRAMEQSIGAVDTVVRTLKGLVTLAVSPKNLGGPLMIYDITAKTADAGLRDGLTTALFMLLQMTAFLSVNLFVFNLIPLPVLDGGQILVSLIESVRRKPLSEAFLIRFQQVGIVMILALMVYVTFHDIRRMVENIIP